MSNYVNSRLTAEQIKFAEALADPTDKRTQAEIALELGVRAETLSRWKRIKYFPELVYSLSVIEAKSHLSKIFGALIRKAQEGDTRAARLVFEATGILQASVAQTIFREEAYLGYLDEGQEKVVEMEQQVISLREQLPDHLYNEFVGWCEMIDRYAAKQELAVYVSDQINADDGVVIVK